MANVFGILTAIVLALSAFIALKNKAAYETEIANNFAAAEALVKTEVTLKDRKARLADELPAAQKEVDDKIAEVTSQEATQQKANADLKSQIDAKTEKVAASKTKLDDVKAKTEKIGNIQELASKMRTMKGELEELEQSITAADAKLANLTAQNTQTEAAVNTAKSDFAKLSSGESLPGLNTRIRSIYPTWGFVTLASGNNSGVVAGSTLDVVRDDEVVAKLLVTAVETSTASASIVPDSKAADTTLMVGDRVVPGLKATKSPSN